MATWRERFAPRIAKIIADNDGQPEKEIRRLLREANPFSYKHGPKWQYKIWCDEVRVQLGLKVPKPALRPKRRSDDDTMTPSMFPEPAR